MDLQAKKTALRKIPHGVYIVGVKNTSAISAFTGTWLTQVSFAPPLIALGVKKDSQVCSMIRESKVFSVNLLGKGQKSVAEHFFKPSHVVGEKMEGIDHKLGVLGVPILNEAIAYVECKVSEIANENGDHIVVIGEVVEAHINQDEPALNLSDTGWNYGG